MISKLVVWGPTRDAARAELARALDETTVLGLRTNAGFLRRLVVNPEFAAGRMDTGLIDRDIARLVDRELPGELLGLAVEGWMRLLERRNRSGDFRLTAEPTSPWDQVNGWRLKGSPRTDRLVLDVNGAPADIRVVWEGSGRRLLIRRGDAQREVLTSDARCSDGRIEALVDGHPAAGKIAFSPALDRLWLAGQGGHVEVSAHDLLRRDEESGASGATLRAPMSGKVIRVMAKAGDRVAKGDRLLILEAMKMEHAMSAGFDAVIETVGAFEGEQVEEGRVLVVLASAEAA